MNNQILSLLVLALMVMATSLPEASASNLPDGKCESDLDSIMLHEQGILAVLKEKDLEVARKARPEILDSLTCLIEIQQNGQGFTKYVANSFMQTFLGGGQIKGVPLDSRYAQVSGLLVKMAEFSKDPAHMLLLEAHSKGEWGLYSLMCEKGSTDYCSDFLPETDKVVGQPPLLAASSMLLLKTAFFKLNGEQQKKVGARIRALHDSIDKKDTLKRRVIDSIFNEVFPQPRPLGMIG